MKIKSILAVLALAVPALLAADKVDMTLIAGDYRVVFDIGTNAKGSIVQIFFKDVELGTRSGWYGSVFCPASGKYIGAGHSEGGKEMVLEQTMTVDEQPVGMKEGAVQGKRIVIHKLSALANLKLDSTWLLTPDGLDITKQVTATAEQPAHSFYLFQKCWSPKTDGYLFFRTDGTYDQGNFQPPPANPKEAPRQVSWPVYGERDAFCFSQFIAEKQMAVLTFRTHSSEVTGINMLWNVPRYHKQYFWMDLPKVIPADYQSPRVSFFIRAFDAADKDEWTAKATAIKDAFVKNYPLFPEHLEPLAGKPLALPPSPGKQQIHKIPLKLEKDTNYAISFDIRKTPGMSKSPNHHYAFVGYYDKASKRYPQLVQLGHAVKPDSEFHKVQGVFRTPATTQQLFIYIYNSQSEGTLEVKDIVIDKQR
ncbi:MAG: hypothetical protein IJJ33_07430 [Victivallales bacterium]|nr:hypothetical protein [Victivallales bacterium]